MFEEEPAVAAGVLGRRGLEGGEAALDFLWRVRNELHFHADKPTDVLAFAMRGCGSGITAPCATRYARPSGECSRFRPRSTKCGEPILTG